VRARILFVSLTKPAGSRRQTVKIVSRRLPGENAAIVVIGILAARLKSFNVEVVRRLCSPTLLKKMLARAGKVE
jgi:hypothetical protein